MVQLYLDEPSALAEAVKTFTVLEDATYATKAIGASPQSELMACECASSDKNWRTQCGPDSGCINRLTCIECTDDDCGCSKKCQNRRFQRHQYAKVDVFDAGRKGFGVRALEDIAKDTFIYEYTGEVVDETRFQRRKEQYDAQGMEHFYFMMLQKDEFIDATMRGSIARFCNHSCSPNAYVEKWVVGPKLRMGLFAKRNIVRGEEITFDYKVDRYGARAQRCLCGEENCVGYLGGRQQTGGIALPPSVVDALSLEPEDELEWRKLYPPRPRQPPQRAGTAPAGTVQPVQPDGTDGTESPTDPQSPTELELGTETRNAKKRSGTATGASKGANRGKTSASAKQDLLDASSAEGLPAKPIDPDDASHVMSFLMQEKEGWLVRKIVERILNTSDVPAQNELMRMHGYSILGSVLKQWQHDDVVVERVLHTFLQWPRLTRNKIESSKIEETVSSIADSASDSSQATKDLANQLLTEWSSLSMGYRIPKRERPSEPTKRDPNEDPIEEDLEPISEPEAEVTREVDPKLKRRLPTGWDAKYNSAGRICYINLRTNEHTYQFPKDPREQREFDARIEKERQRERERQQAAAEEEQKLRREQQTHLERIIQEAKSIEVPTASPSPIPTPPKPSKPSKPSSSSPRRLTGGALEHAVSKVLATYVPKLVFKHEERIGHDRCKKHARDIVHILAAKESRRYGSEGTTVPEATDLTEEKKKKIKLFVHEYMAKVLQHYTKSGTDTPPAKRTVTDSAPGKRIKM